MHTHHETIGLDKSEVYAILFKQSNHALFVTDGNYSIVLHNPAANSILGYEDSVFQKRPLIDFILPADKPIFTKAFQTTLELKGESLSTGRRLQCSMLNSANAIVQVDVQLFGYEFGKAGLTVITLVSDITDNKRIEGDLITEREQNRLLIEHTPAAVAMFDKDMRYLAVSKRWMEDYGLEGRNVIGRSHYEIFPEISAEWKEVHQRGLAGESFPSREESFTREDGTVDWVRWDLCPWFSCNGEIGGIILFTEVITERKNAEAQIRKLNEELEAKVYERTLELTRALEREKDINEMKSRFVSTASHEFRTPLSTLLSSVCILEKYYTPVPNSKEAKHFGKIKLSVDHLTEILNDFLSLDKLDSNAIQPRYTVVNLKDIIEAQVEEMQTALKPEQYIILKYAGNTRLMLDGNILRNAIYNLLSNAIKFSPVGSEITIEAVVEQGYLNLSVSDQGIGIPPDEQPQMFTRLFRAKNVTNIHGTGLGLNIVRKYMDLVQGTVTFESTPGSGTTFRLNIPVSDADIQ